MRLLSLLSLLMLCAVEYATVGTGRITVEHIDDQRGIESPPSSFLGCLISSQLVLRHCAYIFLLLLMFQATLASDDEDEDTTKLSFQVGNPHVEIFRGSLHLYRDLTKQVCKQQFLAFTLFHFHHLTPHSHMRNVTLHRIVEAICCVFWRFPHLCPLATLDILFRHKWSPSNA
jgi:hypothetical protein